MSVLHDNCQICGDVLLNEERMKSRCPACINDYGEEQGT